MPVNLHIIMLIKLCLLYEASYSIIMITPIIMPIIKFIKKAALRNATTSPAAR